MSQYRDETSSGGTEWPTHGERINAIVRFRSIAEDRRFSWRERTDAYEDAGYLHPTVQEWQQAREIEERRHAITRERQAARGARQSEPLSPVSLRFSVVPLWLEDA